MTRELMEAWLPWDADREHGPFIVKGQRLNGVGRGVIDHTVEIIMGDVDDSLTDFERTFLEEHGVDRRGTPTFDPLTDDLSKYS